MKRASLLLLGPILLAGCAGAGERDPRTAAEAAMNQAFRPGPEAEATALPVPDPPSRLQSEIDAMSHASLARWALPRELAREIAASELIRGHMPRISSSAFYRAPQSAGQAGLCEIRGYAVWLRIPNEASLTYRQHLDPPLQPFQYVPMRRWKVVGSTRDGTRPSPSECAAAHPYGAWWEADSADAAHRAISLIERAQARPRDLRLVCPEMEYKEARRDFDYRDCPNAAALLERLTPNLIKRVRAADCTLAASRSGCLGVEYHDPAAPGTHSFYLVTVPDEDRPEYIQIVQGMLPPS